nr:Hpt domain-containing protein [Tianweitania aestuarii]
MGDSELQTEVLALFKQQAQSVAEGISQATPDERQHLAHGLRGSAAGIGAATLARCAAEVEHDPSASDKVARLLQLISEAIAHIDEISA